MKTLVTKKAKSTTLNAVYYSVVIILLIINNISSIRATENVIPVWTSETHGMVSDVSKDGKTVLLIHEKGVSVRNLENNTVINTITLQEKIKKAEFMDVGDKFFIISDDLHVCDARDGTVIHTIPVEDKEVSSLKTTTDGKLYVLFYYKKGNLYFDTYNLETGKYINTSNKPVQSHYSYKFAHIENKLCVLDGRGVLYKYSCQNGFLLDSMDFKCEIDVQNAYFDETKNCFLAMSYTDNLKVRVNAWNILTGDLLYTINESGSTKITRMWYDKVNKKVVTVDNTDSAKVWSVVNGVLLYSIKEKVSAGAKFISCRKENSFLVYNSDTEIVSYSHSTGNKLYDCGKTYRGCMIVNREYEDRLLLVDDNSTMYYLDVKNNKVLCKIGNYGGEISAISYNKVCDKIITGTTKGSVQIWNTITGVIEKSWTELGSQVSRVVLNDKGDLAFAAMEDGSVVKLNNEGGGFVVLRKKQEGVVNTLLYNEHSNTIIVAGKFVGIDVFNANTGKATGIANNFNWTLQCALSPDATKFASIDFGKNIKVWESNTVLPLSDISNDYLQTCISFDPTGKRLVSAGTDSRINIWDWETNRLEKTMEGHGDYIGILKYNTRGDILISGGWNGELLMWNAENGTLLHRLEGHDDSITSIEFSVDDKTLLTASLDGTIRLWDVVSGVLKSSVKGHNTAPITAAYFNSSGTRIISSGADSKVKVWETSSVLSHVQSGIGEKEKSGLYPNPLLSDEELKYSNDNSFDIEYMILDKLGSSIKSGTIPAFSTDYRISSDDLSSGTYFLMKRIAGKNTCESFVVAR